MNNDNFKRYVIDYMCNLRRVLKRLDIDVSPNGLFFCPMHDNYNTPAAKFFKDENGDHFFCFAEHRQYGAYDVYKNIMNCNMNQVFNEIWNNLTDTEKRDLESRFGEYDSDKPVENLDVYIQFKNNQISYQELIDVLDQRYSEI